MNGVNLRGLQLLAIVGVTIAAWNAANADEVKGMEVTITVDKAVAGSEWRHLQRLQIHLGEELARLTVPEQQVSAPVASAKADVRIPAQNLELANENFKIDCSTNLKEPDTYGELDDGVNCKELAAARRASEVQNLKLVTTLLYAVNQSDWDSEKLESAFTNAISISNEEEKNNTPGGKPSVVLMYSARSATWSSMPACENYASPCYYRPNCLGTGKCSKVSTGCAQCTFP